MGGNGGQFARLSLAQGDAVFGRIDLGGLETGVQMKVRGFQLPFLGFQQLQFPSSLLP